MGYNSRRRHYLLLLSTKKGELRFQFVRENWTMKTEKKNLPCLMSFNFNIWLVQ